MSERMKLVIIESPFRGKTDVEELENVEYARRAMLDSLMRGEAPYASHLLYTQCLDDGNPDERRLGITAGLEWGKKAELTAVYVDLGITAGMQIGIRAAERAGRRIEQRRILASCGAGI